MPDSFRPPRFFERFERCAMRRASLSAVLLAGMTPASAEPLADFTRRQEFDAQFAYLDVPDGAPAQDYIAVSGRRSGSSWRLEAVGSNPKLAASVRTCRKSFSGRTVGPGTLRAVDPSGEFGTFELRREGLYVRLVSITPGGCAREGLYLVPSVED